MSDEKATKGQQTGHQIAPVVHTPGPWTIRHGTNIFAARTDVGHEGCICNTGSHGSNHQDCGPENEANARLIAAAPDMLEALEQALQWIEVDETTHGRKFGAGNVAREAIAKATGQSVA